MTRKTKLKRVTLPEKPSRLIRLALKDLASVEVDSDKYVVIMSQWHSPRYNDQGVCAVCFAGSVLAKSCKMSPKSDFCSGDFSPKTAAKIEALNDFRTGCIREGLRTIIRSGVKLSNTAVLKMPIRIRVSDYHARPKLFKQQMARLAHQLDAVGL